jgi:hypothetical protein
MSDSSDPSEHRSREEQFMQHVEKLLTDERLRLDTTRGRRPVTTLIREVSSGDRTVELTRQMSEMNKPDRALRDKMPVGKSMDVTLSRKQWFVFNKPVGRLWVTCASPTRALVSGEPPRPMSRAELTDVLGHAPPPKADVPSTLVVMSTSGFALEANELTERRSDRTVILASPNVAGGWSIVGPTQTKGLADLFDPEADAEKRRRVREAIEAARFDLSGSGLAADHVSARTNLPGPLVEAELKQYAKENPGLVAKRLDGKMVLFRQVAMATEAGGGVAMPLIDKMKALFARQGETEKKIAFLSERRTALSQQRDRGYEEMNGLEAREADLRSQFAQAGGDITKRRITSQLLQLRKDLERRQQLLGVLNQQINVVATHLHNLELVRQGKTAQLPDSDEMAADAAAAEEMIADLQVSGELADSVGSGIQTGMSAEEQALYDELEQAGKATEGAAPSVAASAAPAPVKKPEPIRAPEQPRKATPEAG